MNFKKILVALLSVALLLGLAACGNKAPSNEAGNTTPVPTFDPGAKGMLYLSLDAEVKVTYDDGGLVLAAEAANEQGTLLLSAYTAEVGTPCDVAIAELIKAYMADATDELKVVVIKQAYGSESPSANFLEDVRVDAEAVSAGRPVVMAAVDSLTAEGYLNLDTVREIFKATVGEEAKFTVEEAITNGSYAAFVEGELIKNYSIDADTGRVSFIEEEPIMETVPVETEMEYYQPEQETEPPTDPFVNEPATDPIFEDDVMPPEPEITEPAAEPEITEPATEAAAG